MFKLLRWGMRSAYYWLIHRKIQDFGPETSLGALGFTGLSAYFCLVDTLNLKETDTLVVSGAAG